MILFFADILKLVELALLMKKLKKILINKTLEYFDEANQRDAIRRDKSTMKKGEGTRRSRRRHHSPAADVSSESAPEASQSEAPPQATMSGYDDASSSEDPLFSGGSIITLDDDDSPSDREEMTLLSGESYYADVVNSVNPHGERPNNDSTEKLEQIPWTYELTPEAAAEAAELPGWSQLPDMPQALNEDVDDHTTTGSSELGGSREDAEEAGGGYYNDK